jgi:anti-sigma regulatory factor (Ser/Thr protein kinase)
MPVSLRLPNDDDAPATASAWLERLCEQRQLDRRTAYQLTTCMVEAVNNAACYRDEPARGTIVARLYRGRALWVIQVIDSNSQPPVAAAETPPDPDQLGGRGGFIMAAWMDAVRYRRTGARNVVTLAKRVDIGIR